MRNLKTADRFRVFCTHENCTVHHVDWVRVGNRTELNQLRQNDDYFEAYGPLTEAKIALAAKAHVQDYKTACSLHGVCSRSAQFLRFRAESAIRVLRSMGEEVANG